MTPVSIHSHIQQDPTTIRQRETKREEEKNVVKVLTSSITNSSITCVVGLKLYNCKYSALLSRYFGASARNKLCGPRYRVMGLFGCFATSEVVAKASLWRYARPSRSIWFRPEGFLRCRDVESVPVYSASSVRRCRRTSWLVRSADWGFEICGWVGGLG